MRKSLKAASLTLFIISVGFIAVESFMVIRCFAELHIGSGWTGVGYFLYSVLMFIFCACFDMLSVLCFLEIAETKIKNKYYYLSFVCIVLFLLPILSLIIFNNIF